MRINGKMKINWEISKKIFYWAQLPTAVIIGIASAYFSTAFVDQYGPVTPMYRICEPIGMFFLGLIMGVLFTFIPLLYGAVLLSTAYNDKGIIKFLKAIIISFTISVILSTIFSIFAGDFNIRGIFGSSLPIFTLSLIPTIFGLIPLYKRPRRYYY